MRVTILAGVVKDNGINRLTFLTPEAKAGVGDPGEVGFAFIGLQIEAMK